MSCTCSRKNNSGYGRSIYLGFGPIKAGNSFDRVSGLFLFLQCSPTSLSPHCQRLLSVLTKPSISFRTYTSPGFCLCSHDVLLQLLSVPFKGLVPPRFSFFWANIYWAPFTDQVFCWSLRLPGSAKQTWFYIPKLEIRSFPLITINTWLYLSAAQPFIHLIHLLDKTRSTASVLYITTASHSVSTGSWLNIASVRRPLK